MNQLRKVHRHRLGMLGKSTSNETRGAKSGEKLSMKKQSRVQGLTLVSHLLRVHLSVVCSSVDAGSIHLRGVCLAIVHP